MTAAGTNLTGMEERGRAAAEVRLSAHAASIAEMNNQFDAILADARAKAKELIVREAQKVLLTLPKDARVERYLYVGAECAMWFDRGMHPIWKCWRPETKAVLELADRIIDTLRPHPFKVEAPRKKYRPAIPRGARP